MAVVWAWTRFPGPGGVRGVASPAGARVYGNESSRRARVEGGARSVKQRGRNTRTSFNAFTEVQKEGSPRKPRWKRHCGSRRCFDGSSSSRSSFTRSSRNGRPRSRHPAATGTMSVYPCKGNDASRFARHENRQENRLLCVERRRILQVTDKWSSMRRSAQATASVVDALIQGARAGFPTPGSPASRDDKAGAHGAQLRSRPTACRMMGRARPNATQRGMTAAGQVLLAREVNLWRAVRL